MLLWASEKILRTVMGSEELLGLLCNMVRQMGAGWQNGVQSPKIVRLTFVSAGLDT